jgi:hypothetical protein
MSGNITISSVGQSSPQEWLSLMELVRFRLTASTSATPSAPGWVLYRLLAPDWFATEKA